MVGSLNSGVFMFLNTAYLLKHCPTILIPWSVSFPKYQAVAVIMLCFWAATTNNVRVKAVRVARRITNFRCS